MRAITQDNLITADDIKALKTPKKISKLLDGYDKVLIAHARYGGVGHTEYLCYKRFLDEYQDSLKKKDYPYYFDADEAELVTQVADRLLFYDSGKKVKFTLKPFQRFIIYNLYGWRRTDDNTLRYRQAYISIGRRNGKSLLCSVLALFYLVFSRFKSARGILISLTKEHSKIVFKQILDFLDADDDLSCFVNVERTNARMRCLGNNNTLQAFSGEKDKDGFTSNFAISDEQNASDGKLPQLIMDGQDDQRQALFIGISTASFLINGWGHKLYKRWKDGLLTSKVDGSTFLYICEPDLPPDDDLHHYEQEWTWLQANPYLLWDGNKPHAKRMNAYRAKCEEAFTIGGDKLVSFVTKQCNMWCENQDMALCNFEQLEKNGRKYTFADVAGQYKEWFMGIDLGQTRDFSSVTWGCWVYEDDEGQLMPPESIGNKRLYFHTIQFVPEQKLDFHIKADKFNYRLYLNKELIPIPGERTNYMEVFNYIDHVRTQFDINYKTIAVDPYNISSIQQNLEDICEWLILQQQSSRALSEWIEQLQARINCGDVVYTGNSEEIFKKAVLWCRIRKDTNGYFCVEKASGNAASDMRIDSVDSLLDMVIAPLIEENREDATADDAVDKWLEVIG